MPGHVIVSAVLWLLLLATYAGFYLWGRKHGRDSLSRRRGGYVKLRASRPASPARGGTSTTASTRARFNSSTRRGAVSAVLDAQAMQHPLSSDGVPISYGVATAARGASGRTLPAPAGSGDA